MKKVALITGSTGQLGSEIITTAPVGWSLHPRSSAELDITSAESVQEAVSLLKPDVILNAAAYTAVDRAEREKERAFAVNQGGVRNLAAAAKEFGCRLVHVSTDFVFNGAKSSPYQPSDVPQPLGVYGASKLGGESELSTILPEHSVTIRTAWLYSARGKNFVRTILRLLKEHERIGVVADQRGSPTYARDLAVIMWMAAGDRALQGVYHWVDAGEATWYEFAQAIAEEGAKRGLVSSRASVSPIGTADYPTDAKRPVYSALDPSLLAEKLGVTPRPWRANLVRMFDYLQELAVA